MCSILTNYLNRQDINSDLIGEKPDKDLKTIVIIPAFNEPDIINTLKSLKNCAPTKFPVEIIVLINHSDETLENIKELNRQIYINVNAWIDDESTNNLKFYCVIKENLSVKHAGAGLARKILMDEAIRRFALNNNENGVIVSLDADSLVSENYLCDIQDEYLKNEKLNCSTFYFEHQLSNNLSNENKRAIVLYEMYLRYFKQALKFSGFPYAFYTIGSCFAVKASAYAKQGGMNRKQAGEDFYFLHKIFPLGDCKELNVVKVFPSSRLSDRVPFGTGPAIRKIIDEGDFLTYQPICFKYLKLLFDSISSLCKANYEDILLVYGKLDSSLQEFITIDEFTLRINEINSNSASLKSFTHRFFQWFDAFKIVKYLNFTHNNIHRISVSNAAVEFLSYENDKSVESISVVEVLEVFRKMER